MQNARRLGLVGVMIVSAACTTSAPASQTGSRPPPSSLRPGERGIESSKEFFPEASDVPEFDDGDVSFEEYDAAALRYRECLLDAGMRLGGFDLDPETQIYTVLVDRDMDADPQASQCYAAFGPIDAAWQIRVEAERIALGLDNTTSKLRNCLDVWNIPWDEDMHNGVLSGLLIESGVDPLDCEKI